MMGLRGTYILTGDGCADAWLDTGSIGGAGNGLDRLIDLAPSEPLLSGETGGL